MGRTLKLLFGPGKKSLLVWFVSSVSGILSLVLFFLVANHLNPEDSFCPQFTIIAKSLIALGAISLLFFSIKLAAVLTKKSKHFLVTLFKAIFLLGYWGIALLVFLFSGIALYMIRPSNSCVTKDYGFVQVTGNSMDPTYESGKPTYTYLPKELLKRGCIVVANVSKYVKDFPKYKDNEPVIKRVIAIPGDSVAISHGDVYLNGKIITEPYIKESGSWLWPEGKIKEGATIVLATDEYFVMGDNRNHSGDSRLYGPIKKEDIIGYTNDPVHPELNTCH